jgi:hypothetical protein
MNRIRTVVAVLAAVAMTAAIAGVASAGTSATTKAVPFTAKYSGKAVVNSADTIAIITASGVGKGSPIGPGKVSGKGKANTAVRPCVPFTGLGTMTGTGGTKLTFKVVSGTRGCGDEEGEVFSLTGRATVVSATGKLAKAKGSLKLTGVYDRGHGTFTVKFTGTLTK